MIQEVASVDENGLVTVHKKNGMRKVIISADAMGSKPDGGVVGRYVEVKLISHTPTKRLLE